MGVGNVTALNEAIANGRSREIILVAEALHERQLASIARSIANRQPSTRLVAVSGPTSAGKTTFAKRLALQVMAQGIYPVIISLDDYFVNREDTPRDAFGHHDYEALEAVDVALFQDHMRRLMADEEVIMPRFNFKTGMREEGSPLHIGREHVILVEGIHGLNPRLTDNLPPSATFRVFISAFTQLNLDKHNRFQRQIRAFYGESCAMPLIVDIRPRKRSAVGAVFGAARRTVSFPTRTPPMYFLIRRLSMSFRRSSRWRSLSFCRWRRGLWSDWSQPVDGIPAMV